MAFFVFRAQLLRRALHFAHHGQRVGAGGAFDHGEVSGDGAALRRVEEPPLHVALDEERRLAGKDRDDPGEHGIARGHDPGHERPEEPFPHPDEATVHHTAGQVVPMLAPCRAHGMGHVVGQDQETFHQRCRQNRDDRKGDIPDQIAEVPPHGDETEEGDDRRERCGEHRHGHAPGGIFSGFHRAFAQGLEPVIGMFPHHDGIIHHDAERDDQPEEGDHVDRNTARIHQRDGRAHRHGYASRHPEGRARIQEEEQQGHDQPEPHQAIIHQQVEPPGDRLGPGADQFDRDRGRHGGAHL